MTFWERTGSGFRENRILNFRKISMVSMVCALELHSIITSSHHHRPLYPSTFHQLMSPTPVDPPPAALVDSLFPFFMRSLPNRRADEKFSNLNTHQPQILVWNYKKVAIWKSKNYTLYNELGWWFEAVSVSPLYTYPPSAIK